MLKFGKSTTPILEVQSHQPLAVIFSAHPLIGSALSQSLQQQKLQVLYFPFDSINNPQSLHELSTSLGRLDYFVLIYPHLLSPAILDLASSLIARLQPKVLVIESYLHPLNPPSPLLTSPAPSFQLAYLSDPYGPSAQLSSVDRLSSLLKSALTSGAISVSSDLKHRLYPTYINDLLTPLTKIFFSSQSSEQPFYLSTLAPLTELEFANTLKSLVTEVLHRPLTLDYSPLSPPTASFPLTPAAHTQSLLDWDPSTSLEQGIRQSLQNFTFVPLPAASSSVPATNPTLTAYLPATPITPTTTPSPHHHLLHLPKLHRHRHPLLSRYRLLVVGLFLLFLAALTPPSLFLVYGALGSADLKQAVASLERGSPQDSVQLLQSAKTNLNNTRRFLTMTSSLYFFLPSRIGDKYDQLLDVGSRLTSFLQDSTSTVDTAQTLYQSILGNSQADFADTTTSLKADLEDLYTKLSLLQVALKSKDLTSSFDDFAPLKQATQKLPDLKNRLQLGIALLNLLPQTIGESSPQTYLLLLQNNAELRPTGGFLQSYATFTFQNGKLLDFAVADFSSADAKLQGHVQPPAPLKKYLTADWFARDSNFDPDFRSSSLQLAWFFQKELNQNYAGFVGLNLFTLKDLLKATGPLTLPSLSQSVTPDNLFTLIDKQSLIPPVSPDFHTLLFRQLLTTIKSGAVPLPDLARALDSSLATQNLTLYLTKPALQSYLETQNWSGSLRQPPCPSQFTQDCTSTTFSLIDSNLGVNRVNQFVKREISHSALLGTSGSLTHQIKITYTKTSPTQSWPGGVYKNYLRFYTSGNTSLQSLTVNQQPLTLKDLDLSSKDSLVSYGYFFQLPPGQTLTLLYVFKNTAPLPVSSSSFSLSLNWEKQSGTSPSPLQVSLNYPSSLSPSAISLPADSLPNLLKFNLPFAQDLSFATLFKRQ